METDELRVRFASSPVARLSTVRQDGGPHVVPVVFALVGDTIFSAVDAKPKRSTDLQRLANVRGEPRCALLVDHYEDDWRRLWWVRADGVAEVVDAPAGHPGIQALVQRFPQYRDEPPSGPLVVVTVHRWTGWTSSCREKAPWTSASASASAARTASGAPQARSCWSGRGGRRPRGSPPSARSAGWPIPATRS